MDKILLEPIILEDTKNVEKLSQDLNEEVENFKPYIIKDVLLLSPGIWNGKKFSQESISNGYYKTDWSNKENYALIYSHDERAENWVGNAINRRLTEDGKLYGDLELYDKTLAIKLGKGKAKLGISAKIYGELSDEGDFDIARFNNFSVVYNPACTEAFINLSEGNGVVTSSTSQGSEIGNSHVNSEIDYGEDEEEKKKKKFDINKKGENNRENMEKEEVTKVDSNQSEELNSKLDLILDAVMKLSGRVEVLEKSEEEPVAETVVVEEIVVEEEPVVEEEELAEEEVIEEAVEEPKVEEKDSEKEELSSKLDEAKAEIALLKAKRSESEPKTFVELSKEALGPGSRNFSDMEMSLLNTLNKHLQ